MICEEKIGYAMALLRDADSYRALWGGGRARGRERTSAGLGKGAINGQMEVRINRDDSGQERHVHANKR